MFRGMGQGLFLMLPSMGHKDFLCFYGTGHELFLGKKISQIIFYRHSELSSLLTENDLKSNVQVNNVSEIVVSEAKFTSIMGFTNYR